MPHISDLHRITDLKGSIMTVYGQACSGDNLSSPDELIQMVSFVLEGEEFGVEVLKVREIIRLPVITKIPNAPEYVEGVINLRGKVIPVISLRHRFNLNSCQHSNHTRIIIMAVSDALCGFIVDSVSEVIRVRSSEIKPPPAITTATLFDHDFIAGVFSHGDHLLICLDADKILAVNDFQNLLQGH